MNRRKEKRGKIAYWSLLLIYTGVLIAISVLALKAVWSFAEQYQASQPEPIVEEYISGLNKNLFDAGVTDTISAMEHPVQTDEEVQAAVQEILNGEITYARTTSDDSSMNCYAIMCGDNSFGKVYLKHDETKSANFSVYDKEITLPFDLRPYVIAKEEFDFTGLYTAVEVTIPSDYSVSLNGHVLGSEYIKESGIKYDCLESYYSINPNLPTKVTYYFDKLIGHMDPVIYDANGQEYTIDEEKDDSQYITTCSGTQLERLDEFCEDFIEPYLRYTSGIMGENSQNGYWALREYIRADSDLDKRLFEALDGYSWAHTYSFKLDSYKLTSAIDLGEGYYVCEVTTETTSSTQAYSEMKDTENFKILVSDDGTDMLVESLL